MKRGSESALVTYSSSDDDEKATSPSIKKKRKLPTLSSSLITQTPIDHPELHQGRIRTHPHVEGQFAAHVFVSFKVDARSSLQDLLNDVLGSAKALVPNLNDFWSPGDVKSTTGREFHISLSRPTYLRAHQREDLKRAVKAAAKQCSPFVISFATFSELTNDERTRTFLAMEIGAGHHELTSLSDALTPALRAIRQKEFYPDPHFHASIAWALLDPPFDHASSLATGSNSPLASPPPQLPSSAEAPASQSLPATPKPDHFPTIPRFPESLIPTLNSQYGSRLASKKVGTFDIEKIETKIGKEVCSWQLMGL